MGEVERIHDQLGRAFAGGAWHGPALRELLAGVTSETAARRVLPRAHTIWEIVLHIAAWERAALGRLEGKPMKLSPDEDWPPVRQTSEQAWGATLEMLEEGHRRLAGAVAVSGGPEGSHSGGPDGPRRHGSAAVNGSAEGRIPY